MVFKPLAYGILVFFVLMARSWIGAFGTAVILLVILAWNLWDLWRQWHS